MLGVSEAEADFEADDMPKGLLGLGETPPSLAPGFGPNSPPEVPFVAGINRGAPKEDSSKKGFDLVDVL